MIGWNYKYFVVASVIDLYVFPISERHEGTLFNIGQIAMLPVTAQQLQKATMADPKVFRYIKIGWPSQLPEDIPKLYWTHRNELTVAPPTFSGAWSSYYCIDR